jgi:hypothetical protein
MELTQHVRYEFRIQSGYINAKGPNGETNFVQPFTEENAPKLYVISDAGIPIYVGQTTICGPDNSTNRKTVEQS